MTDYKLADGTNPVTFSYDTNNGQLSLAHEAEDDEQNWQTNPVLMKATDVDEDVVTTVLNEGTLTINMPVAALAAGITYGVTSHEGEPIVGTITHRIVITSAGPGVGGSE